MKLLVCNAGSTSLKFKLFEMPSESLLATCSIERIGSNNDAIYRYQNCIRGSSSLLENAHIPDYRAGVNAFFTDLLTGDNGVVESVDEIRRIGFKTVLAKNYFGVHHLTEDVKKGMRDWEMISPVHTKAYLQAIETMEEFFPSALCIGVFETAFHHTIPLFRSIYAVPYDWHEKFGLQRMGYHGASHSHVAMLLAHENRYHKAISCHLGGSCSICAIHDGKSIYNSFGLSLQSGVIHANRAGDMDGDLYMFLGACGLSPAKIEEGIQKNGGLLGISGVSNDLRYVLDAAEKNNARAQLAVDAFVDSIVRHAGSAYAVLGGLSDLVFTGGIGQHSDVIRRMVCDKLSHMGVLLDHEKNAKRAEDAVLSTTESPVVIRTVTANEELVVARHAFQYKPQ